MLHTQPDDRPETGDMMTLAWLEQSMVDTVRRVGGRRRENTISDNNTVTDIRDEEILDN